MTAEHDEHVIEAIGRSRIVIRGGEVVEVGEARITTCPLAKRFALPVPTINKDAVKANIEYRIRTWGMCTPQRDVLDTREFVGFGASEILSFGLHTGLIDAVVLACDGAGTVIVTTPALVQGIGGRMSGLVSTTPYPEVIHRIEENGGVVIDKAHARLNQTAGVKRALELGYKKVAVTVTLPNDAKTIRNLYPDTIIFGVHVTGLTPDEAETFAASADLMTSCASKTVREIIGRHALMQAGVAIPIFVLTSKAKDLIIEKLHQGTEQVLIKTTKLPSLGDQQPDPLV
ncbi:methanogenesis marker 8 protein [Methanosphaerula palustris]|uniref:Methanogenesis marker protein 8 n=1 Tax=Methanosphaerula palustris (strain ATCC BAA-1556 / DSM 19958 / E1-9c) TaxID=521011 RepID=B8GFH3_METPE|nr:methanogenesis marker 8 protein [Methanosphaerula palustris]ACL16021.1 methanogenesis marker protein 8 [Methanosphaerula palustris E1-9c]